MPFSRWITPEEVKVRYDTWFYLALAPAHCVAGARRRGDRRGRAGSRPPRRSSSTARGELLLVFPTIKKLEMLARFDTAEEALATVRCRSLR